MLLHNGILYLLVVTVVLLLLKWCGCFCWCFFIFFLHCCVPPGLLYLAASTWLLYIYAVFLVPFYSLCASLEGSVRPGFCVFLAQCAGVITFGGPRQTSVPTLKSPFHTFRILAGMRNPTALLPVATLLYLLRRQQRFCPCHIALHLC